MPHTDTPIKITTDGLKKLKTHPLKAIQEIIWNSIDADADNIHIDIINNALGLIDQISIKDDGTGFSEQDIQSDISNLSLSKKKNKTHSPKKRLYHGKRGEGFYRIAHLGDVTWYTSDGKDEIECKVNLQNRCISSINIGKNSTTYTKVAITNFNNEGVDNKSIKDNIVLNSLISLKQYNINIYFDDEPYDYSLLYKESKSYDTTMSFEDEVYNVHTDIIELIRDLPNSSKIIILAKDNTVIKELSHTIKSLNDLPISIYLKFQEFDGEDIITEMDMENCIKNFAKKEMEKFKHTGKNDLRAIFFDKLKKNNILPKPLSKEDNLLNPFEKEGKEIVEEILFKLYEYKKINIDKTEKIKNSKIISELLYRSLRDDNEDLLNVLKQVLDLKNDQLTELRELLIHTPLSNIIKLSQEVIHRIKLLGYLKQLFFIKTDDNKNILERSQLQQLINDNMWLLAEDFIYYSADKSINTWVKELNNQLNLNKETDLSQYNGKSIPDYIIGRKKKGRDNFYSHLVVEIKRPSYVLDNKNIYAETQEYIENIIEKSPISHNSDWEMWFLVTNIPSSIRGWVDEQKGLKMDETYKNIPYKIYIKTWGDIIQQKDSELHYLSEQLSLTVSTADCRDYIFNKYPFMKKTLEK